MLFHELLNGIVLEQVDGSLDKPVVSISFDSRNIGEGDIYIAVPGTQVDGHRFIANAIEKGARGIVCETLPDDLRKDVTYIKVPSSSEALGIMASNFFDNPSRKLNVVGVTGTNGKTTTVTLLYDIFRRLGYKVGLLSTIKNVIEEQIIPSTHTTGDAIQINSLMSKMVEQGCQYCFMEVTSHAIDQNRISGLKFVGGVFTNISHDHLDYHKTFEAYFQTKKRFFDSLDDEAFALSNADEERGLTIIHNTSARKKTYSLNSNADFRGFLIESSLKGLKLEINGDIITSKLLGRFNAYNFLAAYATALLLDANHSEILKILSETLPIDGRFDFINNEQDISGVVDFAHTPDGLEKILNDLREITNHEGRLITVIGCGGDRDREKRPIMGRIAYENSDIVIFTSDNPRSEDPQQIIEEMKSELPTPDESLKLYVILNRKEAIQRACLMAEKNDTVLVAGRGHEEVQYIGDQKIPFKDKQVLQECLLSRD